MGESTSNSQPHLSFACGEAPHSESQQLLNLNKMSKEIEKQQEEETVVTVAIVPLTLDIDKCQKIRALPGTKLYQNTKEGSRYDGKSYSTFLYNGKAFTLPEDDTFCTDLANDNLYEVELVPTEKGYDFIGHRSISRAMTAHKTKVTMKAYTVEFVQTARTIDLEDLA